VKWAQNRKVIILVASFFLIAFVPNGLFIHSASALPQATLTINAQVTSGGALSGMYVALEQGGSVISAGYTPTTFSLTPGQTYQVLADGYGQYAFSSWSNGNTANPITITGASMSLTAIYSTAGSSGVVSSLTVNAQANGNSLGGMYVILEQGGTVLGTGFTPVTFPSLSSGQTYQVVAENYGQYTFSQWSTGDTSNPTSITLSGSTTLTATYGTGGGGGGGVGSLTVNAQANGNGVNGLYVALEQGGNVIATGFTPVTFSSLSSGQTYQVVAENYGQYSFSQWNTGTTANPITLTVSGSTTLTAVFSVGGGGGGGGSSGGLGIVIPLYTYPNYVWQQVINYHQQYPSVPMRVVINPAGGPGWYDSTIASWVSTLQSNGITVLGYVATGYTYDPLSQVETQISDYVSWYGIHWIFLDEMQNVYGYEWYYSTVSNYAHANGAYVMGNPGTSVTTSYIGIFDNIGTYENSGLPSVSLIQSYTMGYAASGFSFIAYNSWLPSQSYFNTMHQYVSWVYVTDNANTWATLPSYMSQEMAEIAAA
jgi:hypothetical protein